MLLVQFQLFRTGTKYILKTLHKWGKRAKTKSQKILGISPTFVEVTWEKLVDGPFLEPHLEYG